MEYLPAKHLLHRSRDTRWFGTDHTMNIYRGCCHGCLYCDSRSACYQNPDFDTVKAKADALRILRALLDGKLHTAGQIAQDELLPQAFAYKILKKLEKAGLVEVVRGTAGGCRLSADLTGTSLYDLMKAMGERGNLSSCMDPAYQCPWRSCHGGCTVHCKLAEIQNKLDEELQAHSLQEILTDP